MECIKHIFEQHAPFVDYSHITKKYLEDSGLEKETADFIQSVLLLFLIEEAAEALAIDFDIIDDVLLKDTKTYEFFDYENYWVVLLEKYLSLFAQAKEMAMSNHTNINSELQKLIRR